MNHKLTFKLSNKEIERLVVAGGFAPSGGNIQPWRVVVTEKNNFELMLDEKRSSSFLDVGHYASYLALGSFVENVLISADSEGLKYTIKKLYPRNVYDPLLQIKFSGRTKSKKAHPLYNAIKKRVTNRKMYDGKTIDEDVIERLKDLVKNRNNNFYLTTLHSEKDKKALADILGKADGIRTFHKDLFRQMMDEIRWNQKETEKTKDGIDIKTLELPGMVSKMLGLMKNYPMIVSTFPKEAFENQAKPLIIGSSHLCCLVMKEKPTAISMFELGRVLQNLWLTTTNYDLAFQPWTVLPFFLIRVDYFHKAGFNENEARTLKSLGVELRGLFGMAKKDVPVFIFRLSYAAPHSARSLRLPWKRFTTIR